MAKLDHGQSEKLLRIIVRGQTNLMGYALDHARVALPETKSDRQFLQFTKFIKSRERALRQLLLSQLVDAGYIEPVDQHVVNQMT